MKKILLSLIVGITVVAGFAFAEQQAAQQNTARLAEASSAIANLQKQIAQLAAVGADNTEFVGGQLYYLHGSGVSASASSIKLTSFTIPQSGQKLQLAAGRTQYLTIEPGNRTRQEFVSCTSLAQNSDDTATFSGCSRGLSPISPYTASTTLQFPHSGGSRIIVSNSPAFYDNFAVKNNDETISGTWTYASTAPPLLDANPDSVYWTSASTGTLVTLGKLNQTALASAVSGNTTVSGYFEQGTAAEASSSATTGGTGANLVVGTNLVNGTPGASLIPIAQSTGKLLQGWLDLAATWAFSSLQSASTTFTGTTTVQSGVPTIGTNLFASSTAGSTITGNTTPVPVAMSTSTTRVNPADANDRMFFDNFHGFAVQSGVSGGNILVQTDGVVPGFSGLTIGADYYVQDAAGTIGTTAGTYEMKVGRAISPTQILIARGTNEYMGTVSASGVNPSTTIPSGTRFITVNVNASLSNCGGGFSGNYASQLSFNVGRNTTPLSYGSSRCTGGTTASWVQLDGSISGSTITVAITSNGTLSGSATNFYFYR
jgi:hypothetical protein